MKKFNKEAIKAISLIFVFNSVFSSELEIVFIEEVELCDSIKVLEVVLLIYNIKNTPIIGIIINKVNIDLGIILFKCRSYKIQ